MVPRILNISKYRSFFLFGSRGVGKSSLLSLILPRDEAVYFDLLNPELYDQLLQRPQMLEGLIEPHLSTREWVVIDEVQKLPKLLDVVHKLIFEKNLKFALTGSSARKLKHGSANLLAGRASVFNLFPLTFVELKEDFNLVDVLSYGTLPECDFLPEAEKKRFLKSYAQTYLREEIMQEQIVRDIAPFRRFLDIAAGQCTDTVVYSNIARDIGVDHKTVSKYYDILEDTLVGFRLLSYHRSVRKKQKHAPKFYFFDTGVIRALTGSIDYGLSPKSFEYGQMFESFIINEVYRLLTYQENSFRLSYLRVDETNEIDLIIERGPQDPVWLCEIKSSDFVDDRNTKALSLLLPDFKNAKAMVLSNDPLPKKFGDVLCLPWQEGFKEMGIITNQSCL